jgi:hypothetical protein
MFLAGGPNCDFNVPTQSSEELHKASNGEVTCTVPTISSTLALPKPLRRLAAGSVLPSWAAKSALRGSVFPSFGARPCLG